MGRSVSYARGSEYVAYTYLHNETEEFDDFDYLDLTENIRETARYLWPSFCTCVKWLDRDDKAILENDYCYIGISEYMGLVSVWLVLKEQESNSTYARARHFSRQIKPKFMESFSTHNKIATFSNGEAIFKKRNTA